MTIQTNFSQEVESALKTFTEIDEKICHYTDILSLLEWDSQTGAPKKGRALLAKSRGVLSTDAFKLQISEEMGKCLEILSRPGVNEELSPVDRACVRERKAEYDKLNQVPSELYNEYVVHAAVSHGIWEEARANNDFSLFESTLEKMVDIKRRIVEHQGYVGHPYNTCLDDFEPGFTVEKLDQLFAGLRQKSIELLKRIQSSSHQPRKDIFEKEYEISKQKEFNRYILPKLGYDFDAGRLDETAHPFAQPVNTGDVRITTRYLADNVRSAIFGTIHECGHGLYEQGINPEFEGRVIRGGCSFGIHESQSRFLENIVGRSREFWSYFYPDLQKDFPSQLNSVSLDEFYRAINAVEPSLIRVEADELTYNLHIMIRYEIEKGLIGGDLHVRDLPQIWNEKMHDYLGIVPPTNSLGVLQDVHWSQGSFGYFPSYSLGNFYAAQLLHTIRKQLPDFDQIIAEGDFMQIREWNRNQIHQYGKLYTPVELIQKITGEELNAAYLVQYLEEKYADVYQLA